MRVMEGSIRTGMGCKNDVSGAVHKVVECGHMLPIGLDPCGELRAGEVGYFTASIKNVRDTSVGDTVTSVENPAAEPLPGYRPAQPMVYCGIYTEDGSKYPDLRDALEKLQLNDASLRALNRILCGAGLWVRVGFLGMLHMEVIQERLGAGIDRIQLPPCPALSTRSSRPMVPRSLWTTSITTLTPWQHQSAGSLL